jgi:uncharacterized protein with HEPN domain
MKNKKKLIEIMLEAINDIEDYSLYLWYLDFLEDKKTIDACITQLAHLWETAKKLKEEFWDDKEIPFYEIIWLRNLIAHNYLWISYKMIYDIIEKNLPELKNTLIKKLYSK